MKTQTNLIMVLLIIVVSALIFGGLRLWNTNRVLLGGAWPELEGGVYAEPVTQGNLKYLVPPNQVYDSGLSSEDRPALTEPKYDSIEISDTSLADELEGIAVEVDGQYRFYPFQILNWHPIVNDTINDQDLAITYATLSGSAVVYSSAQGDDVLEFADAGKVYNNTMLMSDGVSETLWNQTSGQALVGSEVGQHLDIYPSEVMTWEAWKDSHPGGLVLSVDTGFSRDYGRHPYASYETSPAIFFPVNHDFAELSPKDLVYRLDHAGQTMTFMERYLIFQTEINETLGDGEDILPVVAFYDTELNQLRVYDRRVGEQTLTFARDVDDGTWTDQETGSVWTFGGVARSGRHEGDELTLLPMTRHYAFAHFALFPNTIISGDELFPPDPEELKTKAEEENNEDAEDSAEDNES